MPGAAALPAAAARATAAAAEASTPLSSTANSRDDDSSPNDDNSFQVWYVVTKTPSLAGPAIFSKRQDCIKHVMASPAGSDYKTFASLSEAVQFFSACARGEQPPPSLPQVAPASNSMELLAAVSTRSTDQHPQESPHKKQKTGEATEPLLPRNDQRERMRPPPNAPALRAAASIPNPVVLQAQQAFLTQAALLSLMGGTQMHPGNPQIQVPPAQPPILPPPTVATNLQNKLGSQVPAQVPNTSKNTGRKTKTPEEIDLEQRQIFEERFAPNLERLKQFKEEYGDTDVPFRNSGHYTAPNGKTIDVARKYAGLGQWCSVVRTQFKVYQANKKLSYLSSSQMAQLRQVGLCMEPLRGTAADPTKPVWSEKYYQELVDYVKEHGHANPPSSVVNGLQYWIIKLRDHYKRKQDGQVTSLTDEHIQKLTQLGFEFRPKQKTFDEYATLWLAYRAQHQGQDPPPSSNLGRWMQLTRRKYQDYQAGKKTPLTKAQVDKLNEWGFKWKSNFKTPQVLSRAKTFDERLEELKEYKKQYGDCLVPQVYPGLGSWVSNQRKYYRDMLAGKKSPMTSERLDKLKQVGFCFEKQPMGPRFLKAKGESAALATQSLNKKRQDLLGEPSHAKTYQIKDKKKRRQCTADSSDDQANGDEHSGGDERSGDEDSDESEMHMAHNWF